MCGRYNLRTTPTEFAQVFAATAPMDRGTLLLRYNIAPTQPVVVLRSAPDGWEAAAVQWGLIPGWSKDPRIGSRMINARAETAAEKPSFRAAFKRRRCLIPASGFYEWDQHTKPKQPYHITPRRGGLMAFAGLWERWSPPDGDPVESCSILTTSANAAIGEIHDRMPVILAREEYDPWLAADTAVERLQSLLRPAAEDFLQLQRISTLVNNVRNTGPEVMVPV